MNFYLKTADEAAELEKCLRREARALGAVGETLEAQWFLEVVDEIERGLRLVDLDTVWDELRRIRRLDCLTWVEREQIGRWLEEGIDAKGVKAEVRAINVLRMNHYGALTHVPKHARRTHAA